MTSSRLIPALLAAFLLASGGLSALADWRDEVGAFRIGIIAGGDPRTAMAETEPFRLAIEEKLGLPVEVFPARDYAALVDASANSRIEYAVLSSTAYALAFNRCECIEPLVVARSGDGTDGFSQILITRRGGPASLSDLKGKRIATVGAVAFGGLDIALRQLTSEGLKPEDAELVRFAHGDEAIAALAEGAVDAMIGWSTMTGDPASGYSRGTLHRIAELEGSATGYHVLWQSAFIAYRVHAVRKNLPGEARTQLRDLLSTMFDTDPVAYDSIEPIYGGGFIPARQGQFNPLAALLKAPAEGEEAESQSDSQTGSQTGSVTGGASAAEQGEAEPAAPAGESEDRG